MTLFFTPSHSPRPVAQAAPRECSDQERSLSRGRERDEEEIRGWLATTRVVAGSSFCRQQAPKLQRKTLANTLATIRSSDVALVGRFFVNRFHLCPECRGYFHESGLQAAKTRPHRLCLIKSGSLLLLTVTATKQPHIMSCLSPIYKAASTAETRRISEPLLLSVQQRQSQCIRFILTRQPP